MAVSRKEADETLGKLYARWLVQYPLKTKTLTAFVLSALSSTIAQLSRTGGVMTVGIARTAIQYAVLQAPPYSHFWYQLLEKISRNPVIKVFFDQLIWRPLLIAYTFLLMSVVQGRTWNQVKEHFRNNYVATVKAGWRIWPAAQLLNQSVVPLEFRTVSMDCVSFFWDMYLTLVCSADEDELDEEKDESEAQAIEDDPKKVR